MSESENKSGILSFFHCRRCMDELLRSGGGSPRDHAKVEVGLTRDGFVRVWCRRHEALIADVVPTRVRPGPGLVPKG